MYSLVAQDWREKRIAELEAELRARNERITEQDERIAELEQQVTQLKGQVAELAEKLGQNSQNSHRPPSTDPPDARKRRKGKAKGKGKSQRKRGGQPGHRGANRELLPMLASLVRLELNGESRIRLRREHRRAALASAARLQRVRAYAVGPPDASGSPETSPVVRALLPALQPIPPPPHVLDPPTKRSQLFPKVGDRFIEPSQRQVGPAPSLQHQVLGRYGPAACARERAKEVLFELRQRAPVDRLPTLQVPQQVPDSGRASSPRGRRPPPLPHPLHRTTDLGLKHD
jgi:uncharacterized coiled-coil protein SlyX